MMGAGVNSGSRRPREHSNLLLTAVHKQLDTVDALLPTLLPQWHMMRGGMYFVTPSARTRPVKIKVLSDFFARELAEPTWRWPGGDVFSMSV